MGWRAGHGGRGGSHWDAMDDGLRYEMHVPDGAAEGGTVAVLLHGRGADRRDLLALAESLPDDVVLVTPEAPHPGRPWGYGPGWAWYRYRGENRVDPDTLETSLAALDRFLNDLDGLVPASVHRLVLGGFSQGGTTSLAYALAHPGRVAGVINFSGFLADGVLESAPAGAARGLPVFWGHGTGDPNIPHAMGEAGRAELEEAGAVLTARDYPIGHWIAPEEMAEAVRWMKSLDPGPSGGPTSARSTQ